MELTKLLLQGFFLLLMYVTLNRGDSCPSVPMSKNFSEKCNEGDDYLMLEVTGEKSPLQIDVRMIPKRREPSHSTHSVRPDYKYFENVGFFKLHTERKDWKTAKKTCEEEGAHLAIVNSEEESAVLRTMFAPLHGCGIHKYAHIGFHDMYDKGKFLTVFDIPLKSTGFDRWYAKDDNYEEEDCGSIHNNGGLNDISCNRKLPFFCEIEPWSLALKEEST